MTVQLHLAARTDLLADALGELLRVPGEDPFAEELVVVPAKGVERWLTQLASAPTANGVARIRKVSTMFMAVILRRAISRQQWQN